MRKCEKIRIGNHFPAYKKYIIRLCICFSLIILNVIQPISAAAADNTLNNTLNSNIQGNDAAVNSEHLYEGGELHAFYPSNAVYSEQLQTYIDAVDSLSFAWSRIDAEDPGNLNVEKGKNGNTSFYYPEDYLQPIRYAKSKGKSIQLNIYMSGSDCTELLPYEDKRSLLLQAIIDYIQKDITPGEGIYYDGVVIDFEGLRNTDDNKTPLIYEGKQIGDYFTEFLTDLKQQLELQGKKLYVAVNPSLFYDGYHYDEILGIADRMILMAHDYEPSERLRKDQVEQYTGYDALEPINSPSPIQMVRQALDDIRSSVSDSSKLSKVWLQIAFDSAQWQFNVNGAEGWEGLGAFALSIKGRLTPLYKSIKLRVDNKDGYGKNLTYGYNNELQSPFIQYYNTHDKTWNVILYEDSNSIGAKLDLAKSYGLGGISIWSLGNLPDYNDTKGKKFHLDGWSAIISKMNLPYTEPADSKKQISFTDKIVEQAVREKLGKLTGKISVSDVSGIYRLALPNGVKNLSDMKNLVNLEYLDAKQLNVKDITALGKLTHLRVLYLQRNQISDLSPIKKLTLLEVLSLNGNQISSLNSLSALTQLQELYLSENKITDITPLSKLSKLRILNIGANSIQKVNSLARLMKLEKLYIAENKVTSIFPLTDLKALQVLTLDKNRISDLKPLAKLSNLTELYLPENKVVSISSLKSLKNLKVLSLNRNSISDLRPLAQLVTLEKLYLKDNKVTDIAPLKRLLNLQELYLYGNKISDYNPVSNIYHKLDFQCDFILK